MYWDNHFVDFFLHIFFKSHVWQFHKNDMWTTRNKIKRKDWKWNENVNTTSITYFVSCDVDGSDGVCACVYTCNENRRFMYLKKKESKKDLQTPFRACYFAYFSNSYSPLYPKRRPKLFFCLLHKLFIWK